MLRRLKHTLRAEIPKAWPYRSRGQVFRTTTFTMQLRTKVAPRYTISNTPGTHRVEHEHQLVFVARVLCFFSILTLDKPCAPLLASIRSSSSNSSGFDQTASNSSRRETMTDSVENKRNSPRVGQAKSTMKDNTTAMLHAQPIAKNNNQPSNARDENTIVLAAPNPKHLHRSERAGSAATVDKRSRERAIKGRRGVSAWCWQRPANVRDLDATKNKIR